MNIILVVWKTQHSKTNKKIVLPEPLWFSSANKPIFLTIDGVEIHMFLNEEYPKLEFGEEGNWYTLEILPLRR